MTKVTPAQQDILDQMARGHVLSSMLSTKYRPFSTNPEHGGELRNPHVYHTISTRTVLLSTIKAMLTKGLIVEDSRYICSSGTWGSHETETWNIKYTLPELKQAEEQRERRVLFIHAMRHPEMRLLRLALRHLDWDKGIDWRDIQFIHVEFYADDRCWMLTTDKYLVVCFQAQNPALTYEDFSLIYLHQQDNPDCPCEFCVVERREVRHE